MSMKLEFHQEILTRQNYSCTCCGRGCRLFLVAVRQRERQAIESQRDWRKVLNVKNLFVRTRKAGPSGAGLAKHPDGRCVFLNSENLCEIHRLHGLKAKPIACQLYPFVLTPFADRLRVGLRFDCSAVCLNQGEPLTIYQKDLQRLADQLVPPDAQPTTPPPVCGPHRIPAEQFDALNDTLIKIIASDAMPLLHRLHWLRLFIDQANRVKWRNVPPADFPDMTSMLLGATLAQSQRESTDRRPIIGKPRKLLGQYFFILSHPTTYISNDREGVWATFNRRLSDVRMMKQLGRTTGPLSRLHADWPQVDLQQLEQSFGPWPAEIDHAITRYLCCRLGGLNYCGPNFYNYSMVDGARSLMLAAAAIGWLMRIAAMKSHRQRLEIADTHDAIMTLDGNLGYAHALATGPARWRLGFLSEHLESIINWYCS